jgi:EAL domain-containing protein (putative c-di-GMP-specific phosphodiesterase class I)
VRSAITRGQVTPFYQPKIAIDTGRVVGFEALIRIVHDNGCIDVPKEFTSALEDPEVGRALGLTMVERVAADMKVWLDADLDITVAINVSTTELRSDDYVERVLTVLRSNRIPTSRFEIEVTETAAFDDEAIGHNLHALAISGISVALDDFGTGFASLTHLKSLPIAQVKIDRSFVANILADPECRSIVGAIVDLSHNLGKSVVAEGVENEVVTLRRASCSRDRCIPPTLLHSCCATSSSALRHAGLESLSRAWSIPVRALAPKSALATCRS